jgi:predicted AAA+ superfamily ATPase
MKIDKDELIPVLSQFNPWWRKEAIPDLPSWKRSPFYELLEWVVNPPTHRAVMLSGPRQVGKTTLVLQTIDQLIKDGVPATNILYVTFDHPIFKLAGLDAVLEAWRELEPKLDGPEYLFLDEAQFIRDFGTWVKHQIDFFKSRRIVFTGSAMPLANSGQESGVGRWHTLQISTLSFYEYLQIKKILIPNIPSISSLKDLFKYSSAEFYRISEATQVLIGHFHEYLVRGGFPQTALVESIPHAQRLLREDIIDKVLKRDMTALFGVRRVLELEQTFIYLCMHDGGIQDLATLSTNLGIPKPTVQNFINLLEATHLLYRLPPFGYGKEILRARYKLYLADPAIAPAILMKGKTILEDSKSLGNAVETTVFSHLAAHSATNHARFSYWKDSKNKELDLVVEVSEELIPLEVKYQSQVTQPKDVQGLINFCRERVSVSNGYILTKASQDIGLLEDIDSSSTPIMRIPASIFCYWLGESEILRKSILFAGDLHL